MTDSPWNDLTPTVRAALRSRVQRVTEDVLVGVNYPASMFRDEGVRIVEGIVAGQIADAVIAALFPAGESDGD